MEKLYVGAAYYPEVWDEDEVELERHGLLQKIASFTQVGKRKRDIGDG